MEGLVSDELISEMKNVNNLKRHRAIPEFARSPRTDPFVEDSNHNSNPGLSSVGDLAERPPSPGAEETAMSVCEAAPLQEHLLLAPSMTISRHDSEGSVSQISR